MKNTKKISLFILTLSLLVGGLFPSASKALWDTKLSASPTDSRHPKIVWTGSAYGFVWQEKVGDNFQVQFREASELGVLSSPVTVSDSSRNAFFPDIAWNGEKYAVVWQDDREGMSELFLRFVKPGGVLGSPSLRLTYHEPLGSTRSLGDATMSNFDIIEGQARRIDKGAGAFQPRIVWNGSEFGIVFADARSTFAEIYFMIVRNGAKAFPEVQVTKSSQSFTRPSVIWDGETFGLTWENNASGSRQVLFARVDSLGRVVSYPGVMSLPAHSARTPTVAWNGSNYLMVYEDYRQPMSSLQEVTFNKKGQVLGRMQFTRNDEIAIGTKPVLVWVQDKFLLFWQDERWKKPQVFLAFLDSEGNKISAFGDWPVVNSSGSLAPQAVWNGKGAGLVWTDFRDQQDPRDNNTEVYFNLFDIWAPSLSNVRVLEVRDREVTLGWNTSELSDIEVRYDSGKDLGTGEIIEKVAAQDNWTREHEITINDLMPNTAYHFRVRARDVNDNRVTQEINVTTLAYTPATPPRRVVTPTPATGTLLVSRPPQAPETYAYGKPRVKNLSEEHYRYLGLRRYLQAKLPRKTIDQITGKTWERYVRAVQYGGYPASVILQEVKTGVPQISDTVPYQR